MTPLEWLMSGDTGISSKTILSAMTGTKMTGEFGPDIPRDGGDFGRCYRLLKLFPEWRENLQTVADVYPKWGPLVREWSNLEKAYEADLADKKGNRCYKMLRSLVDECYIAGGWERIGNGGRKKTGGETVLKLRDGASVSFGA